MVSGEDDEQLDFMLTQSGVGLAVHVIFHSADKIRVC